MASNHHHLRYSDFTAIYSHVLPDFHANQLEDVYHQPFALYVVVRSVGRQCPDD
jgi:hypothetical protein